MKLLLPLCPIVAVCHKSLPWKKVRHMRTCRTLTKTYAYEKIILLLAYIAVLFAQQTMPIT